MGGEKNTQHFIVLDGMRGIAAIAVAYYHATQLFLGGQAANDTTALAVDFFFCLSGFVVAYAYGSRLDAGMPFGEFVARRAIRLYPMIVLGATLGGIVLMLGALRRDGIGLDASSAAAGAFLLIPAGLVFGSQAYPTNNPIWSLFFECVANLAYARAPACSLRRLRAALAASAAVLVLVSYASGGLSDVGFENWHGFALGFVRVCYPFLAGVLIFRLGVHGGSTRIPAAAAIVVLVAALSIEIQPAWAFQAALSILVYPLVVALGVNAPPGALRGAMVWLGNISYPLYLIHQPLLRAARNVSALSGLIQDHPVGTAVTCVAACCALSTLVFHAYDEKVRRWAMSTLLGRGPKLRPAATVRWS